MIQVFSGEIRMQSVFLYYLDFSSEKEVKQGNFTGIIYRLYLPESVETQILEFFKSTV